MRLNQVFVGLTKTFNTVNRNALWKILNKLGCSDNFLSVPQGFHEGMIVCVNVG